MTRRYESLLASSALILLLALTLFYGCRAFDPEPVIVNRAPDTFITGAPAETTGTGFLRHMYWYGTDLDGEVVRYIWALTDSTVRDASRPDEDEEDARFNPALDVTTLEPIPGRIVGYTERTDSLFLFQVDRGATPSKDVTFHVVAVDDRGSLDPTPARLHFINNSLGNPILRFKVSTFEDTDADQAPDTWILRWTGAPGRPEPGISPEDSPRPFVGFSRQFRIEWEASSPNGAIVGYRYKASQDSRVPFTPPSAAGAKQWGDPQDPAFLQFVYDNDQPPETFPDCNPRSGEGCPPESIRWPSDDYVLRVEALDVALVESEAGLGELRFDVNYGPETDIITTDYPEYQVDDGAGGTISQVFSELDTIPNGSYALFKMEGYDRLLSSLPDPDVGYGPFCCDKVLDGDAPEVRFQGQTRLIGDEGFRFRRFQTLFSTPAEEDTIGFVVGPFVYTFLGRTEDEHERRDPLPKAFQFVGGFLPKTTGLSPTAGDSLILKNPLLGGTWPENTVPYPPPQSATKYWDGVQYLNQPGAGRQEVPGYIFRLQMTFEGKPDDREPWEAIRAWTFALLSENDPNNLIIDGRESSDLSFYVDSPEDNRWQFSEDDAVEIFVPTQMWFQPELFDWDSDIPHFQQAGQKFHARQMGKMTLRVQGRTTNTQTVPFELDQGVRPGSGQGAVPIDIERMGRRTELHELEFHIFLGLDPAPSTGRITRLWPDECTFEGGPPREECELTP